MPSMKIVTWNVNSLRARVDRAAAWLDLHEPDVVALQETKVVDEEFPRDLFTSRGYELETFGQPTYNGVAIAARQPIEDVTRGFPGDGPDDEKRLIAATVGGFRLIDVYVVNGKEVGTPHFEKKLAWLDALIPFMEAELARDLPTVLLGDFNIAPADIDIWDADRFRDQVLCSPPERERYARLLDLGLEDLFRRFHEEAGLYSWWDYRQLAFQKRRGWRIDLLLTNPAATALAEDCFVDKDERRGSKPSDHAPVFGVFRAP